MTMAFATLILSPFPPPQPTPHFSFLQFHGRAPLSRPRLSRPPLHRSRTFPTVGSRQNRRIFSSFDGIKVAASVTRETMIPPYNVLITGSTKGIGYALAKEFRRAGDNVIISSRSAERVESALQSLRREFGEHVWGTKCDVRIGKDVKDLATFAQANLKYIDIWVNNAGSNAYSYKPLAEASDEDLIEVVTTNTLGLMICCREAIKMMLKQPRGGHIFNIDGAGSDGRPTPRQNCRCKMLKMSLCIICRQEWSQQSSSCLVPIQSRLKSYMYPYLNTSASGLNFFFFFLLQAKFFINVLAEPAEVVAEYLVPNIRSIPSNGSTKPTYVRFLTGLKAYSKIFSRLAFGARRNRYLLEE